MKYILLITLLLSGCSTTQPENKNSNLFEKNKWELINKNKEIKKELTYES